MIRPSSGRKVFWTFLAGVFLVQLGWIAAMPVFRGPDEFDHTYRAQGLAHGQLLARETANDGRGGLTETKLSVIRAAGPVCASYPYTGNDNCNPVDPVDGPWNRVASGSSNYNPTYYALVGFVSRPFEGAGVNHAMRVTSALLCAGLMAWSALLWNRRNGSRWSILALLTALTPVLVFSTAVAAPNGLGYAAALLLWAAALALLRGEPRAPQRPPLVAATVGAVLLCNTHTTGPMWLALIVGALLCLNARACLTLVRQRAFQLAAAVVFLGGVASFAWTMATGANITRGEGRLENPIELGQLLLQHALWILQTIAVFPLRNEPVPPIVYVLWLVPFAMLLWLGARGAGRVRLTMALIVVLMLTASTALTVAAYPYEGYAWQGRYALPLAVGVVLVPAAYAGSRRDLRAPALLAALLCMAVATAVSIAYVARKESAFVVQPLTAHVPGGPYLAAIVAASGVLVMASAWNWWQPRTSPPSLVDSSRARTPAT